jgi:hypothetical protein
MSRKNYLTRILLVSFEVPGLGLMSAQAAYPDGPIKMIVPWTAGSDTDAIFRVIAARMEKQIGKPVVIVNITGALGTVGAREAKKVPPDGYRLLSIQDLIPTTYHTGMAEEAGGRGRILIRRTARHPGSPAYPFYSPIKDPALHCLEGRARSTLGRSGSPKGTPPRAPAALISPPPPPSPLGPSWISSWRFRIWENLGRVGGGAWFDPLSFTLRSE